MSLLSAIPVGVLAGFLLGGRLSHLERLRLRWWALIVSALAIQVVVFTAVAPVPSGAIPFLYLLSNGLACAWLVRNIRVAGVPCISLGSLSNLAAIALNGGRMPVDQTLLTRSRGAAFALGVAQGRTQTNSVITDAHTRLVWLTDRFLLPPPFPFPVVFSAGDVLIAIGVAWLIAAGMRRRELAPQASTLSSAA
ncbi:MAG: hypothetical protein E6J01_01475 [Chloroflexi bacterium]|nr:MAG: hypothetical protein E6J01_01475 [Chloroflexota bacterium]